MMVMKMMVKATYPSEKKKRKQAIGLQTADPAKGPMLSEYGFQETSNHPSSAQFRSPRPGPSIFHI
jgi:hypothetical protein